MNADKFETGRQRLLSDIDRHARETATFTGRERYSEAVMAAMAKVPRHHFLPPGNDNVAYVNRPQSIGHGQTISQPFIVAVMTDLLDLKPTDRVLEIGTGCGYQSAILAEIAGQVYSVETIRTLADSAARRLETLGYNTIHVCHGDGAAGWPEEAPFDAIIVTAAPQRIPNALSDQLKTGGRMVIPVGPRHSTQILKIGVKKNNGKVSFRSTLPVAFVPMV